MTGVAAVGAAIAGAPVSVKDATGAVVKGATGAGGDFLLDVSTLKAPFMLRVQQADGTFLYSASVGDGVATSIANINPLSNVIIGKLTSDSGVGTDPNALYQGFATFSSQVTTDRLDRAAAAVYGKLSPAFKANFGSVDFKPDLRAVRNRGPP